MNTNYSFKDLTLMHFHKFCRVIKLLLPWAFITLFFSVVFQQSTYYQFYNRCHEIAENQIIFNNSDTLCGIKTCNDGFVCANPLKYDQTPDKSMYSNNSNLAFGYFQYANLIQSYFAVVSSAFLTNSSKIIDMVTIFICSTLMLLQFCSFRL